ncbi:hypothetical protein PIB30_074896 [Stylosanthes scabra]|uniref:Uncharacterized protein n=1 Tax=Stylosanthes scabra TaxID=79078 RepID=A0ABU6QPD5_9FABA|nr:hypothetical protein [Stylosanthes scabra]
MGSGIIYYEIEKREKYEDSDERADSDLAIVKTWRYHFNDESFTTHFIAFSLIPIVRTSFQLSLFWPLDAETFQRRKIPLRKDQVHQEERVRHRITLPLVPWELIPPSKGWMCEGDEVEGNRAVKDIPARVDDAKGIEKEGKNEGKEEEEEEEDQEEDAPEEEMSAIPRPMDVDTDEDYLQYLEEFRPHPEYSPIHSSQTFAQHPSNGAPSPSSDARSQASFDLSGIWPPLVGPSQ